MPTPLTVEFIGSRADAAEALTNYTVTKLTGGGQGPSTALASLFVQGSNAIAMDYPSASKLQFLHFDDGATTWDFSSGGTEEGQLIWVWGNALLAMTSTGTLLDGVRGGLGVVITDNATISNSWAAWTFYGSENYPGGFQKMVIDPTIRPTSSGGTFGATSLSSIRGIGIFFVSDSAAKGGADAAILDAIDIGSGLRVFGSGTPNAGFKDLLDADEGDNNNQYGVIRSLGGTEDIVQFQGVIEIGSGASTSTYFDDINRIVAVRSPLYLDTTNNPSDVYSPVIPSDFQNVTIQGNATSGTFVTFGEKVGDGDDARGRNGLTFLGNNEFDISFSFDDGNVDSTLLYGTTIRNFNGTLDWSLPTSGHEFIGSIIDGCSQYNASSGVVIRNSAFQNHTGNDGAFLYNSGTDIKNCNFLANSNLLGSGAAIQHPFSGSFIYDNLTFSDNDFDINFSLPTSGDLVIQATNGADPATSKKGNVNSTVDIQNTVLLTLTDIVVGSEVRIYKSNPTGVFPEELAGTETEDDGTFLYAYNYTGDFDADIVVVNTGYVYFRQNDNTLTSSPATIKINQVFDRNYENP